MIEIDFQIKQTIVHFTLAFLASFAIPSEYFEKFYLLDYIIKPVQPTGIQLLYTTSTLYHSLMYFYDPFCGVSSEPQHFFGITFSLFLYLMNYHNNPVYNTLSILMIAFLFFLDLQNDRKHLLTKIHHIVTILLLMISWIFHHATIGSIIIFINDLTDVPMFILRILHKKHKPLWIFDYFFAAFTVLFWIVYRIYYLTYIIIQCYVTYSVVYHDKHNYVADCSLAFLSILLCMNVYWTFLVIFKAIKA